MRAFYGGGHTPPLQPNAQLRTDCEWYAWRALGQQEIAYHLRGVWPGQYGFPWVPCLYQGPRWNSSFSDHFNYCYRIGVSAAVENEDHERRKAIAACRATPG